MRASHRLPLLLVLLLIAAPVSAIVVAPNDTSSNGSDTLQVDGYVTTKFATVGTEVSVHANVRGADSSNTLVTADILHYRDLDPLDRFNGVSPSSPPIVVDTIALSSQGVDEFDSSTTVWMGTYTVPVTASGGVYGASVTAQSGNLLATDNPSQISEIFGAEVSKVLQSIDDTWDMANPTADIAEEFTDLRDIVMNNGGWDQFVEDACRGSGALGSEALWDEMIDSAKDENQYNMSAGAEFLEELMLFLESDDSAASVGFVVAVLTYLDQFPIPRVMNDFQDIPPYLGEFDLIENFTRFEGTGDFEAAYDAMTATGEWDNITTALDNLANNQRQFESIQTLMRNIAVLSISDHPEAIGEGLGAFIGPLLDEDFDNMTPFQRFLIRFVEMADRLEETDIQDTDGDDIPDRIVWEYEKVLDTPEGQAWTAKMQSDHPHVNTAFSAFNNLPENILNIALDSLQDPAWNVTGEVLADFGEWLGHFAGEGPWDDFSSKYDEENATHFMDLDDDMDSIPDFKTFEHNMYTPMIGIKLDVWNSDENHPNSINFGVTQSKGQDRYSVNLEKVSDGDGCGDWNCERYVGVLEIPVFEDEMWEFDDILDELKDSGVIRDSEGEDRFEMEMQLLSLPMIVQMGLEGNDEIFTVSALGVLVESPQQSLMGEDITIRSQVYNGVGPVEGAEVEVAVLRISPQAGFDLLNDNGLIGSEDDDEDDDDGDDDGDHEDHTFYCDNGMEIYDWESYKINNEQNDCGDWSDETPYETYYPCDDGNDGVEFYKLNNDDFDCDDESDEGVTWFDSASVNINTQYRCDDDSRYVGYYSLNNGWDDCDDASDEQPDAENNLDKVENLTVSLDGDAITDEDEDGTDDHCYMFDVDVFDGDGNELFNDYVMMSYWGSAEVDLGAYADTFRKWSIEGTLLQYPADVDGAPTSCDDIVFDADDVTDESIERSFEGALKRVIRDFSWDFEEDEGELDGIRGDVYYDSVWGDDENYNVLIMIVDGNETGPSYTSFEQMDYDVGEDDYDTEFELDTADLDPGYYCIHVDLRNMDDTVVDAISTSDPDKNCFTIEEEEEDDESDESDLELSPELIDSIFTDGPFEVFTTVDLTTNENGEATLTITPSKPGTYISIVQAKAPHPTQNTLTGLGGSISVVTNGSLSVSGMDHVADFSGFPVYTVDTQPGAVHAITITPNMLDNVYNEDGEFSVCWGYSPLRFDPFFPDISSESWGETDSDCVEFQDGDTSRTSEIRVAPMGSFGMIVIKDGEIWPRGMHAGFILASPEDLVLNGDLGPGQTTNIALADATAERILAIAAPEMGIDPALVDVPTVSDQLYDVIKSEVMSWHAFENGVACDNEEYGLECIESNTKYESEDLDGMALIQDLLADMNSIAWGEGSSADLRLPVLSSPIDDYTILSVAQVGTGDEAYITSALHIEEAVPNPEPPQAKTMTVSFSPADPRPGDTVQVLVVDKDSGNPIEDMSVTLMNGPNIVASEITGSDGTADFTIIEGTLQFRVSGGLYVPTSLILIVSPSGIEVDGDEVLPVDSDGDGVLDSEDAFPNDSQESVDSDGDGVGDNADVFPDDPNESADSDGDGIGDNAEAEQNKALVYGGIGVLVFVIIAVVGAIIFLARSGGADMPQAVDYAAQASWSEPPMSAPGGGKPSPTVQGQMRDGYEVVEYPDGSGNWWWRDPNTGNWNEWT
ncbi:MAG: hypothetical protein CMB31_05775 [Euryarchaeota archaeon]|nr:hypothetical protein [Euryarchaeota archaeon]